MVSFTQIVSYLQALVLVYPVGKFGFLPTLMHYFHASSFWALIFAAGGLYGVLISKNGSLLGPYLKAWGSLLVLVAVVKCVTIFIRKSHIGQVSTSGVGLLLSCE